MTATFLSGYAWGALQAKEPNRLHKKITEALQRFYRLGETAGREQAAKIAELADPCRCKTITKCHSEMARRIREARP